jgi:hypothetical protein
MMRAAVPGNHIEVQVLEPEGGKGQGNEKRTSSGSTREKRLNPCED